MNKYIKTILSVLAVLFGLFLIVFGGYDDSPGAQGLGLVSVVAGIVFIFKSKRKN